MNEDYNYFQGKDFRKSLAAYEHMVATGEPAEFDSETLTDIAEYYAMNQRMDDADRCIQYALSFYPDSVDPQIFLSRQQMFFGQRAEAWRICNAITDQDDREVIFLRAELPSPPAVMPADVSAVDLRQIKNIPLPRLIDRYLQNM